jgi:rubrerythrin
MGRGPGEARDGDTRQADVALLREALKLETAAVERYVQHSGSTSDPRLQTYWESLRRNEAAHRAMLKAELLRLGIAPDELQAGSAAGERP